MFEPVKNRFLAGKDTTREQYEAAWHKMLEMREVYHAQVAGYDAVLAPSVAIGPPSVTKLLNDIELFQKTNLLALRNTRFFNMFGTCALTLPTSRPAAGLMVVGKPMAEKDLVSVGLSIEEILKG
jgi:aspartyl-tRNA(Asn)/glutamyl-tRNA(Gln) amidotransferase subunit A